MSGDGEVGVERLDPEFAARMRRALAVGGAIEGGTLTQREVARRVTFDMGLPKPMSDKTASRYFGGRVPDLKMVLAFARAMHVPPGWLAFGEEGGEGPATSSPWVPQPRKD